MKTSLIRVTAVLALLVALAVPSTAAAQALVNEPLVKNLMSLGLAHPATGKLFAGSLIDATTVVGASVQSTDNTLNSVSLDDEILAFGGRGMLIVAYGTLAANVNTKDIKLKIGGTAICTIADNTGNGTDFAFYALVLRDGVDTERGTCLALVNGALVAAGSVSFTAAVDQNATMAIITTGDNNSAAASAATGKGLTVIPIG